MLDPPAKPGPDTRLARLSNVYTPATSTTTTTATSGELSVTWSELHKQLCGRCVVVVGIAGGIHGGNAALFGK